jgi:hypothetical protein
MESLPINTDHPAVKDYLALVRLQVLTPLSLLVNIATVLVCTVLVDPGIRGVTKDNPTSISPRPFVIAVYVCVIYAGQIGYCILLVLARKQETKNTLVKGVGLSLVFANWVMAGWAIAWVLKGFLASTVLLGILVALLLFSNISLLIYHAPTSARPFDAALIHAPLRFFLVLPLSLMFPYSLFVTLGRIYDPAEGGPHWAGFCVVLGINLLGLLVVIVRRDIVYAVAATWICISVFTARPKPAPVYITEILFTVLHPLALLASCLWFWLHERRREGRIALGGEEGERGDHEGRGPREVDTDGVWG